MSAHRPEAVRHPPGAGLRLRRPSIQSPGRVIAGALGALCLLSGCATRQLAPDFEAFSRAYADDMNQQMLLNLARLDQGHPAYFMAIGEVRVGRSQSLSLQGSGNTSRTAGTTVAGAVTRTVSNVLGGSVTPGASAGVTPSFVFIPINSDEAAKQLLSPISIDVFNMLYQQGWPVDQLLRVLVERIEVDLPGEGEGAEMRHITLVNSPTRGAADRYARFLRACEIVRALQKEGGLNLVTDDRFSSVADAEVASLGAKELMDAADKGRVWRRGPHGSGWVLGSVRPVYRFQADPAAVDEIIARFQSSREPDYQASLVNLKAVLSATVATTPGESGPPHHAGPHATLILRSFRNVLEAVASEHRAFAELKDRPEFKAAVPPRQLRPVLQIRWDGEPGPLAAPAASLRYAGERYQITDAAGSAADLDSRWNRDVFRLLVALSSQVTVDITKFQRQVLEITQ